MSPQRFPISLGPSAPAYTQTLLAAKKQQHTHTQRIKTHEDEKDNYVQKGRKGGKRRRESEWERRV